MTRAAAKKKPSAPKMRRFLVQIEGAVEIEVADELLKSYNTNEWREQMFPFNQDEEFVKHIAYNMVINGLKLESIDGYADQPPERVNVDWRTHNWDLEAEELNPPATTTP